jgi:hypothetical protein
MTIQWASLLRLRMVLTILLVSPCLRGASDKYGDAKQLLTRSPWAAQVEATMDDPADVPEISTDVPRSISQAGQPNVGNGNMGINTRWDGQIGRNRKGHLPTIPVMVRWDSAAIIRHALEARQDANAAAFNAAAPASFILSVIGLLPAKTVQRPARQSRSSSDEEAHQAKSKEEILEWFMGNSLILMKGQTAMRPKNVTMDEDSGTIHLFFNRADPVMAKKPDLQFETRYGTVNVEARFRVKDMLVDGRPDL